MAKPTPDPHENVVLFLRVPRWLKERIKRQCPSKTMSEHCSEILEREFWEEPEQLTHTTIRASGSGAETNP